MICLSIRDLSDNEIHEIEDGAFEKADKLTDLWVFKLYIMTEKLIDFNKLFILWKTEISDLKMGK